MEEPSVGPDGTRDGHVVFLDNDRRTYVNFAGVYDALGESAVQVIDDLVGKQVLTRGLIFGCSLCSLSSWYDLAGLSSDFKCRRCGKVQQFTRANWKHPEEPHFYYALAETVYQCLRNNSDLTILALDHLRKGAKSFEYLPEMDLLNFPRAGEKHEIDIVCLIDGQIALGEAKTEPLRPAHARICENLAKALPRRPEKIVFATSLRIVSDDFAARVATIPGAFVLTAGDLK